MEYKSFIQHLNSGDFTEVDFSICGYGHYRNCRFIFDGDAEKSFVITLLLTHDGSEKAIFHGPYNEGEKVFYIKGIGRLNLFMIWKRVEISNIIWAEKKH